MCVSGPCMAWGWCLGCGAWSGMGLGWGRGVCGAGEGVWVEEWEGVFDVDRVGWDDCALVVGGGVESVVYGVGGVGGWC